MTILVPDIIERKELEVYFRFSRQFVEQWTTGYKKEPGVCMIPPMPHIEGPPMQFHRDSVMKWRLQYFQVTE